MKWPSSHTAAFKAAVKRERDVWRMEMSRGLNSGHANKIPKIFLINLAKYTCVIKVDAFHVFKKQLPISAA
jgi:hypothetical protein